MTAGPPCRVKRVQRHMAEQGLCSVVVKKYNHHANHGSVPDDKANILKRDFGTETINQKWCTDITYIHVQKEGWTYLASVMDLCSRKIIGYAYGGWTGSASGRECLPERQGYKRDHFAQRPWKPVYEPGI